MTESSTEQKETEVKVPPSAETKAEVKVPVAAIAKEREQKRVAQEALAKTQQELQKVKEANPQLDMEALLSSLAAASAQHAKEAADEAVRPLLQERQRLKMAVSLGLNEAQADAVASVVNQYGDLPEKEALLLAKARKPDLFPETRPQPRGMSLPGSLPVTGDSPSRSSPEKEDFMAKMRAAEAEVAKGNVAARADAQHFATQEFMRRARELFNNRPRI